MKNTNPTCKVDADGTKAWRVNGKLHRDNGLPAVERADGTKAWYLNDKTFTEPEYFKELYKLGKITKEELFVHLI